MQLVDRHVIRKTSPFWPEIDDLAFRLLHDGVRQVRIVPKCDHYVEESYTSQASFMDGDPIPTYRKGQAKPKFSGRRIARGLYRTADGSLINADVNGSYNILQKAFPENGIEAVVVQPVRITPNKG